MAKSYKSRLYSVLVVIMTIATTAFPAWMADRILSEPRPISWPLPGDYSFTVVGMGGTKPVEMIYERSVADSVNQGRKHSETWGSSKADLQAYVENAWLIKHPIVWADTGRAIGNYRYYLTKADLRQVNSQLDSTDPNYFRRLRVKVLKDDPRNKCQTLKLIDSGDKTDSISVYEVKDNRIRPLKWTMYCGATVLLPFIFLSPAVFILSRYFWKWLLGMILFRAETAV